MAAVLEVQMVEAVQSVDLRLEAQWLASSKSVIQDEVSGKLCQGKIITAPTGVR